MVCEKALESPEWIPGSVSHRSHNIAATALDPVQCDTARTVAPAVGLPRTDCNKLPHLRPENAAQPALYPPYAAGVVPNCILAAMGRSARNAALLEVVRNILAGSVVVARHTSVAFGVADTIAEADTLVVADMIAEVDWIELQGQLLMDQYGNCSC